MNDDDDLCLCFRVSLRKVKQFIRVEQPRRTSQLSECYGAGTGCGWCRPFLEKLMDQQNAEVEEVTPNQYAEMRRKYRLKADETL